MPNLRRLSPITWVAVVTVLVALIPDQLPLGLARSLARYLLIAYLPGLAIWSRLKSSSSSLVDLILYPSLLSILPFAWIGLAAVALGSSLRLAACIAIAFFLVVGFWFGWSAQTRATRGDNIAIFRVDRKTGGLSFTGHYTPVGNPSIIVFLDLAKKG